MALFKRGEIWWYDFWFQKRHYTGSTYLKNKSKAAMVENKVRTDAALSLFGLTTPKVAPIFKDFMDDEFLPHVRQHSKHKPRTVKFYSEKTKRLLEYPGLAGARLTEIDEKLATQYGQWRATQDRRSQGKGKVSPTSINRELATLRKALGLAYEWRHIGRVPKIRKLPGEVNRDFILSGELEALYLEKAVYPLKQAAVLLLDLGLRTDECVSLKKSDCSETVRIREGKSENADRSIPVSARAKLVIAELFELWPDSEWLFPGQRKGTHLTVWALDNLHAKVRDETLDADGEPVFPKSFVVYSLRHTFGTRLAETGASPFDIKYLMGHSDVRVSQKYIHLTPESIERSMKRKESLDVLLREGKSGNSGAVPTILAERDTKNR